MNVLITGASGGLGTAVVQAFLDTGASTIFGVARSWPVGSAASDRFHPVEADLGTASECERVAKLVGPVDALVHLLGGFTGGKPVSDTSDSDWQAMLDLNLTAAFHMFRAALPALRKSGKGKIIAVGSKAAMEPMANYSAYGVSKAALVALIKTIALEEKDHGITANIVLPSIIDTPINRKAMPKADFSAWVTPQSIANLLVWLAGPQSADLNGAVIPIYGRA